MKGGVHGTLHVVLNTEMSCAANSEHYGSLKIEYL